MKITSETPNRTSYKLVRTDSFVDIPGEILEADSDTGEARIQYKDEIKSITLGPDGFRIVQRGRYHGDN